MTRAKPDPWVTTEQVAAEVNVTTATIRRWSRLGVLPAPQVHFGGRRGRYARWPLHTPDQARWVQGKLEAGYGFEEIAAALAAGEYKKPGE